MGFGSYDESEQQNQEVRNEDESEGVNVHETEHEGKVTFESGASAADLLDQLEEIKSESADE